jgi:hypothetical protein
MQNDDQVDLVHISIPILVGAVVSVLALGVAALWAQFIARALV